MEEEGDEEGEEGEEGEAKCREMVKKHNGMLSGVFLEKDHGRG